MENDKEKQQKADKKFKEKMKMQGKSELRGYYLDDNLHIEAKKILKLFVENRAEVLLFCNSLDQ